MGNCLVKRRLLRYTEEKFENIRLASRKFPARVLGVYDGDTITIGFKINGGYWQSPLRIYGIDAPELNPNKEGRTIESINLEKAAAIKARDRVAELTIGKLIIVETHKQPDKFGRLLGAVYVDDQNLSEILVKEQLVVRYYGKKKENFDDYFKHLEKKK